MKKILGLTAMALISGVANASTEYYVSAKLGVGDTIIYADGDTRVDDYLVKTFNELDGASYKYSSSGLLWDASFAVGVDWSLATMYVKKSQYDWFHVRLEGEVGYNNYREQGKLKDNYVVKHDLEIRYDNLFILANGYADFRINRIVPYLGLGLGYGFDNEELTVKDINFSNSVDDGGIIYALHAGVGYKYSDVTTLDLGYRRVYAPTDGDGLDVFSAIRFGIRFRI